VSSLAEFWPIRTGFDCAAWADFRWERLSGLGWIRTLVSWDQSLVGQKPGL